jgi:hypothetical protein
MFANGAVTAAFARAFNDEMQSHATGRPYPKFRTSQSIHGVDDAMLRDAFDYVAENNPASIREDLERGRVVTDVGHYDGKGNWVGGTVVFRDLGYTNPNAGPTAMVDASGRLVRPQYMVHTHGGPGRARDRFSEADMTLAYVARIPVFMSDYQGNFRVFTPNMRDDGKGGLLCSGCVPTR